MREQDDHKKEKNQIEYVLQKRWVAYTIASCSAVVLYVLLSNLTGIWQAITNLYQVITPVVSGVVIAYLINPLSNLLETRVFRKWSNEKGRHKVSVMIAVVCVLLIVILLLVSLIPSLGSSFEGILKNMDSYKATIDHYIDLLSNLASKMNLDISSLTSSWDKLLGDFMSNLSQNLIKIVSASYNVGMGAFNLVIGFIMAIYFLLDKENMVGGINKLRRAVLSEEAYDNHTVFWSRCHNILIQYIIYNLLDGLIVGSVNAVFMLMIGMPYVVLISVVVGITNLLPTFGPVIGGVIGGVILVLNDPMQALIFLIFTVVLQAMDGYVLKPKLFGGSLGVPAVWILITIILGGKMFGMVGILLAIPFTAIFMFVYEETLLPALQRAGKKKMEAK